jgi:hypothetical protein
MQVNAGAAMQFSRRQMMKMTAGGLLAAGLWPRQSRAADPATKPLKFIQVNDFHYFDENCDPFFEGLVKEFNQVEGAAFVLVVGDLVDGGTLVQCHAMRDILAKLKIPYFVTCGNHDPISQTDRGPWEAVFGTKLNVYMENNGWQFIGMDTSDGTKASGFDCHKETLDFAASLPEKLDKDKPTFVYTHFPLGPGVTNRLRNADALLEPFKQLNVKGIFTGHYHAFTEKKVLTDALATTDVCCSFKRANHDNTFEKGFFVVDAAEGKFKRTFVEYGTTFKGAATPSSKPLPTTRPEAKTDRPVF